MAKVLTDGEHRWYEVKRGLFICASSYREGIRQYESYGFGWTVEFLLSVGLGPFDLVGYEKRPKIGEA